ncbi:MAG: hypothetical protein JSS00_11300 [Proteobacteria bacterium]|nr:hypothetical protein [Pseudomonadota bacterium]
MRIAAIALVLALCGCGPSPAPAEPAPHGVGRAGAGGAEAPVFAVESAALVGRWSFDRSCGLYDLVFNADNTAGYYDYSDEAHVVSYAGRWSAAEHNRIVLTLRRLNDSGAPSGEALTYKLDVAAPVANDLIGRFGPSVGDTRAITAKRCPEEDRE